MTVYKHIGQPGKSGGLKNSSKVKWKQNKSAVFVSTSSSTIIV